MAKVWFITGSSRGFGRHWTEAALERGDSVAATARSPDTLSDLVATYGERVLPLALDVNDRAADFEAVKQAHEHFGRLDVVVNNAGYGLFGTIEEVSEEQARAQIETNLFGALWVTQAAVPILREQRAGHIIQVSSIGGLASFPGLGLYNASKWALEGFSEALAAELAPFGVHVTLLEPQSFDTDWAGSAAVHAEHMDIYEDIWERRRRGGATPNASSEATREAILEIVDSPDPPLRVLFGAQALPIIKERYSQRLELWEHWNELAVKAGG
ncbi:MAG: SDR family oxidoreductase [Solirubrobacteraceae bacterium]|jgi:NAD(P)-dependent dehydrogenase (short-subunit alcohol dehydrogenase family)